MAYYMAILLLITVARATLIILRFSILSCTASLFMPGEHNVHMRAHTHAHTHTHHILTRDG